MKYTIKYVSLLAALGFAIALISSPNVQAGRYKIKCKGPYQLVQGNRISSTYCEEAELARVARSYGRRVSARSVRRSASLKISLCLNYGHDIRLSGVCGAYGTRGRN